MKKDISELETDLSEATMGLKEGESAMATLDSGKQKAEAELAQAKDAAEKTNKKLAETAGELIAALSKAKEAETRRKQHKCSQVIFK